MTYSSICQKTRQNYKWYIGKKVYLLYIDWQHKSVYG